MNNPFKRSIKIGILLLILTNTFFTLICITGIVLSAYYVEITYNTCEITNVAHYNYTIYGCTKPALKNACYEFGNITIGCQKLSYTFQNVGYAENICPESVNCEYKEFTLGNTQCYRQRYQKPFISWCNMKNSDDSADFFLIGTIMVCSTVIILLIVIPIVVVMVCFENKRRGSLVTINSA